ncbi:MAG TPA: diacylglycerol kinase family protein [Streptosporangiaceae bacterium]|nr:diacylglycerol kinase family protein [Streptosporangiaceae bacterium]
MRALLIVNPRATTTTKPVLDAIVGTLTARTEIEVVETRYRGDARDIATRAAAEGWDALLVLSGDGTINEVVNGLMDKASIRAGHWPPETAGGAEAAGDAGNIEAAALATDLPAVGALPGGNANVFTRDLGTPADPMAAAELMAARLAAGTTRTIGLGLAGDRYFTFNAGLGWDAEVVRGVEDQRAQGRSASSGLYMRTALRHYYRDTDRGHPGLAVTAADGTRIDPVGLALISNTTPWTYAGQRPVCPTPAAAFEKGLDAFLLRRLRTVSTMNALRQMLRRTGQPLTGKHVVNLHDQAEITVRSAKPVPLQVDGDYVGDAESVTFRSVPDALRVIA